MWGKSKDSILVLIITVMGPKILQIFSFPIEWHHRAGFYLFGAAAIMQIWIWEHGDTDKIQQVFEAKKIHVDGKYPRLVKEGSND